MGPGSVFQKPGEIKKMKMPDDQIKMQSFHGNFILVHNQMSGSHVSVNYYQR